MRRYRGPAGKRTDRDLLYHNTATPHHKKIFVSCLLYISHKKILWKITPVKT